jgi:hypothetical protein
MRSICGGGLIMSAVLLLGCVAVFRHDTRPTSITVTEQASGVPQVGVLVSVAYTYDGYQYIYVYNAPHNASGTTDAAGRLTLPVADFKYGAGFKVAGYAQVHLSPEQIRAGGSFPLHNAGTLNAGRPALVITLHWPQP